MSKFSITRRSPTFHVRFRHGGINALYPLYCHAVQSQILPLTSQQDMDSPTHKRSENKITGSNLTRIWEVTDDNILTFPAHKNHGRRLRANPRPKRAPTHTP